MKKEALIILVLSIIGIIFISGCAPDYEEDENEVFVEIEDGKAKVEIVIVSAEWEFELDTVDLDTIINEISSRTGLSIEEINAIIEVEIGEESTDKPFIS
ncbi:MAG: hypothetical protein IH840_11815 [Candidatus Heimdallarchaeota archaeon]|nr:hypothetical protein [Candidatus Heimdallarchaeota archaeon]